MPGERVAKVGVRCAGATGLLIGALIGSSCSGTSGCADFEPTSTPLEVGESQEVEVAIGDGGWSTPDVAASYWSTDAPVPEGVADDATISGEATLVSRSRVRIDFGDLGVVDFTGPIGCM